MKPELSFPEFNREWDYNLFSEIVTNKSKRFDPKNEESLKDIELDSIEQNTGRLLNTYMSKDFTSQKNKFDKGSVLYSKLRPYLNKYYYAKIDGVCSSEIWVLNSLYSQKLSNLFLYYFIQTNRFSNVANKSAGSKMPRADWSLVENIRLYKGSIEEQRKIGDFFSKLDQQIELEEQKLAKLEEQKKGYMQKIFSQELRFKDENGNDYPEWEIKKLMQIAKVKTGSKNVQDNIQDGKFKFFDRSVEVKYLNTFDFDETAIIYPGEGSKFLPRYFSGKYSLHQRAYSIYDININNNYLYYYLSLQNNHFLKYAVGSTVKSLRMSGFDKLKVMVPKNSEQEKIGDFFNELDELIEKQSSKIGVLKQRKKGFLQKMFV